MACQLQEIQGLKVSPESQQPQFSLEDSPQTIDVLEQLYPGQISTHAHTLLKRQLQAGYIPTRK